MFRCSDNIRCAVLHENIMISVPRILLSMEMFREHPEPGFSVFSKTHRSSVIKIRIVRKKKHHLRLLRSLDIPFVIEQPNSQRSTVVVSVHPHFITCVGISMLTGPSVFQNNESIPTYNQFEFLSSPSSSPAISDFEPICLISPFGGPALFVWFEKPPPAQASVFNVSQLFSVPLCGECPAMSESVGITVCHVMCPTEKELDSCFAETMIPLVPYQSPCNGWL